MRVVAAIPAIGLLAGSALGFLAPDIPTAPGFALLVAVAAMAVWARRRAAPPVFATAVCAAFLVGGALLAGDAWRDSWRLTLRVAFEELAQRQRAQADAQGRRLPEDAEAFAVLTGVLRSDAAPASTGVSLSIDVDSIGGGPAGLAQSVGGGLQATVVGTLAAERADEWRAGRRVRLPVQLRRPSRYLNPGVPDYERALARRGTTLVGTVKSGALVETLAPGGFLDERFGEIRAHARRAIYRAVGSSSLRSAGIVAAIVIGDRAGLDDEVQRRLQEAGTYHVIAISGGNIAILAGLMLVVFRVTGTLGRAAMLAAITLLVAYARLVGGGASVDRATVMAVVYFAARGLDQRSPPLNTLALTAACLVAAQPLSVVDSAFLLTFGATLAILLVVPLVRSWNLPRSCVWAAGILASSVATEIAVLPIGALSFSRVTFAGLGLNFAAIPLMAVAQVAGMALVPIALVSTRAASVVGYVAHLGAAGLVRSADLVQVAPSLSFRVAPPAALAVGVYYVALVTGVLVWRRRFRRGSAAVVAALAALWIVVEPWAFVAERGDGRVHVTFLDVGQGDSTFVRLPRGTTLLVDAGGLSALASFDIGDRVVAPVLRTFGVKRLDLLALTHGDPDHIGGAASVIREFRPHQIWEGIPVPPFEPLRLLRAEALTAGATWSSLSTGDHVTLDEVEVLVRHPDAPDWERQRVRNDDSMVVELRWRDMSVLLTGDIGSAVERTLSSRIPAAPIRIVKVPHHGSLTSSSVEFIRAIAPTIAVASAGRTNHFGHPVPDVLRRYRDAGAKVFRTDQDGAVTVDTDGYSATVRTFNGRQFRFNQMQPRKHEGTKDGF